jgi:hypothetical protein
MEQTADREQARLVRVHAMEGIIPLPVWLALFLICGVIFVYVLRFADPGERATSQAMLMGSVTAVITLLMLLLVFFNSPHGSGGGTTAADRHGANHRPHRNSARRNGAGHHPTL